MELYNAFIAKSRYARFREDLGRRENWDETVDRLREAIAIGIDATQRESQSLNKKNTVDVSSTTDSINPLTEKIERL